MDNAKVVAALRAVYDAEPREISFERYCELFVALVAGRGMRGHFHAVVTRDHADPTFLWLDMPGAPYPGTARTLCAFLYAIGRIKGYRAAATVTQNARTARMLAHNGATLVNGRWELCLNSTTH